MKQVCLINYNNERITAQSSAVGAVKFIFANFTKREIRKASVRGRIKILPKHSLNLKIQLINLLKEENILIFKSKDIKVTILRIDVLTINDDLTI